MFEEEIYPVITKMNMLVLRMAPNLRKPLTPTQREVRGWGGAEVVA